jgi:hypothetical protein
VTSWVKQNGLTLFMAAVGVFLAAGQYQQRQAYIEIAQAGLVQRVESLERTRSDERARLDAVYVLREVEVAQRQAILNRLDELKADLQELRRLVR